jgi:hypothetical protein
LLCLNPQAHNSRPMRIRVIQRPSTTSVDGLELGRFEPGRVYEVGTATASLMLSEGWAEPAPGETPAPAPPQPKAESRSAESTSGSDAPRARADERSEAEPRERSTPPPGIDVAADYRRRR